MHYLLLFTSALFAATILPAQSEAVLVGLLLQKPSDLYGLLLVATLGNTLGAMINWWLGRYLQYYQHKAWFPVKPATLVRVQHYYQKYGWWSLLLSWLPLVGDPLTVVAGMMQMRLLPFACIVALAKGGRYAVLAWMVTQYQ